MSIKIIGDKEIQRKIALLANPKKTLKPAMETSMVLLHREIAPYPPQAVPIEVYRRTGTLGRKWTTAIKDTTAAIRGTIGNNTPYAVFVQGDRQAGFHKAAGWTRADENLEKNESKILGFFKDAIDRALR